MSAPAPVQHPQRAPEAPTPSPPIATNDPGPRIAVSRLVDTLPPFQGKPLRANPLLDEVLSIATLGDVGDDPSYDILVRSALAIAHDPGSAVARFTHACLLAERGLHDLARRMLLALWDRKDCPACLDALFNVAREPCAFEPWTLDFHWDPEPSKLRAATERVLAKLGAGDPTGLEDLVEGTVTVSGACSVCDEERITRRRLAPAAFAAFVRSVDGPAGGDWWVHGPVFLFCDGRCCSGPTGMLSHSSSFVTSVCFKDASARTLSSIDMIDG